MVHPTNKPTHADSLRPVSRRPLAVILLTGLLFACGCGGDGGGGDSAEAGESLGVTFPAKITFHMTNNTKSTLKNIMIEGFAQNVKFTSLPSGGSHSLMGLQPMNMATSITVSWKNPKGSGRPSTTAKGALPKNFNGTLYFTITGNGKVTFRGGTVSAK